MFAILQLFLKCHYVLETNSMFLETNVSFSKTIDLYLYKFLDIESSHFSDSDEEERAIRENSCSLTRLRHAALNKIHDFTC